MKCLYRNCNNELQNKRKDAKFCCRQCKTYERTYLRRIEKSILKSLNKIQKMS